MYNNRILPSRGPAVLRLVFVLVTIALVGCSGSPQQRSGNQQACLPAHDRPSCFYVEALEQKNTKLIIFVRGVFGSAATTWGNPRREAFWPAMVAKDPQFAGYDIYLINYHTPYLGEAPDVHETAGNELEQLLSRKILDKYDEIYFIAHSMGGLVTKSLLTQLNRGQDVALLRRVKGVAYLSTPAQGADGAGLAAWLALNPQLGNLERAHLGTYIVRLEDQWIQLMDNRDKVKAEFPRVYCAYETRKSGPVWVVPKELASSRCDGPLYPMPFHHFGMAKPSRSDDDPYRWTMGKILEAGVSEVTRRNAAALLWSAAASVHAGDQAAARRAYDESSALYVKLGDRQAQANVLRGLGDLESLLGRNEEAQTAYTEARSLYRVVGDRLGEANVLNSLGHLESKLGRIDEARTAYMEARNLYTAIRSRLGEANVLVGLGDLESQLGRTDEARTAYTEAHSLYKAVGSRLGEANALVGLGHLEFQLGRKDEARTAYMEAHNLFKAEGGRLGEAHVLRGLGDLEFQLGRTDKARNAYTEAHSLYKAVGSRLGEAHTLLSSGRLEALINPELARQHFHQAASIYEQIGMNKWREIALSHTKDLSH
ncbi:MAG: tetratricopeptide repeat protein [Nitrospira sp.]|nr:MAG: tetratricopeptide repeat protein [Nitrospira sp.]